MPGHSRLPAWQGNAQTVSKLCAEHVAVLLRTLDTGLRQVEEQEGGGCRVHHRMAVTPTLAPPRALGFYTRRIFERQVRSLPTLSARS